MATPQPVTITLNVTSDTICPFCYLGYRKIDRAIQMARAEKLPVDFQLRLRPFQLDPTLPKEGGVSKVEKFSQKFGARAPEIFARQKEMGRPYGINFVPEVGNVGSTVNSHRLLERARKQGGEPMQRKLCEILFAGYFEHSQDISDLVFLSDSAAEAGLFPDAKAARVWLVGNEGLAEVEEEFGSAKRLGISGVPFTIINGEQAISGAQEPETFLQVFRQVAAGKAVHIVSG